MYDGDFVGTVRRMLDRVDGAYALEIICADEPDKIICTKKKTHWLLVLAKAKTLLPPIFQRSLTTHAIHTS